MATRKVKLNSALGQYLDEVGQLPSEVLLGNLVIYTITDGNYSLPDLTALWTSLALPASYLPVATKPIDAFKRATTEVHDYEYPMPDGNVAHVLVRDVHSDTEVLVRHLVREVRDKEAQRLSFATIGTATFYRPSTDSAGRTRPGSERFKLHVDNAKLEPNERESMQALIDEVSGRYDRYVNFLDGQKVRAMVRGFLGRLNAIAVKPSVYFVHNSRTSELEKLREVVNTLGGSSMHHLPIVDLPSQRAMVIEAFQTEAVASLEHIVKEIQRVRSSRSTITADAYAKIKTEYDDTLKRTREYSRLLGSVRDMTIGAEEVAQAALLKLAQEVTA